MEIPEAVVERITFHNPENGFTIARVGVPGQRDHLTIVGYFTEIAPGEVLALQGEWTEHPRHGPQFKVSSHATRKPSTLVGIERYLGSGLIKGIGPVTARRIVERFGTETLDIIDADVRRLLEVPGLGPGRLDYVRKAWEEQRAIRDVMVFLKEHGVSTAYAVKIYKTYGDQAVRLVSEDPYRLAKDIWGVGFVTADRIARSIGIPLDAERRLGAGLRHVLGEAGDDGHCYLPRAELIARAAEVLEVPAERVEEVLGGLASSGDVIADPLRTDAGAVSDPGTPVYHPALYHAERGVAQCLRALLAAPAEVDPSRVSTWIDRYAAHTGVQLSPEQREAVMLGAASRVLVITGGPGTGKTTTVRTLVKLFQAMGKRIALCSPTGRAAQRLEEVTGTPAATIHRLLEWSPAEQGFTRHQGRPLEADVVITDEVSMLDISLAHNLLRAVLDTAQAILVGDVDQLPSVGPGNVLRDLIASGTIPVVRFRQVFRQAAASAIITNAHRINEGQIPLLVPPSSSEGRETDCLFMRADEPEQVQEALRGAVERLARDRGFDPVTAFQVLCPMHRGTIGTRALNALLQQVLNPAAPGKAEVARGGTLFREGDKVIQQVNDYERGVFNGDLGVIARIDLENQVVHVTFGGAEVHYDLADLDELAPAWAITIHKSQGSEYPACAIIVHTQHFPMLSRNLLYTALTRARRLAVVIGTPKALAIAVRNAKVAHRYTGLARRLAV